MTCYQLRNKLKRLLKKIDRDKLISKNKIPIKPIYSIMIKIAKLNKLRKIKINYIQYQININLKNK